MEIRWQNHPLKNHTKICFSNLTQKPPLPEPKSLSSTSEELEDRMHYAESFRSSQGHLSSFFWTVELSHWPDRDWRNSIDSQMERVWIGVLWNSELWTQLSFGWTWLHSGWTHFVRSHSGYFVTLMTHFITHVLLLMNPYILIYISSNQRNGK